MVFAKVNAMLILLYILSPILIQLLMAFAYMPLTICPWCEELVDVSNLEGGDWLGCGHIIRSGS